MSGGLEIVYADDDIAVIDKPAGLLSCPGRAPTLFDSVQTRVPQVFPAATGSILVHRLDQPTSGLLVVALHADAHRTLRRQFEARTIEKVYDAILVGIVAADDGTLRLPFRLDVDRRPLQIYDEVHGKWGETRYAVLERDVATARTRVRLWPVTGRTHQLRTHAAHPRGLGCPIAGDALYGDVTTAPRLMLHASSLSLHHPCSGERMSFSRAAPFG
jgi:tRNA pseudouridine32 synthase/23S rRNA pseudouridine746 synthase